nr:hypothetical protein HCOI_00572700 [Haemonchus contortus]
MPHTTPHLPGVQRNIPKKRKSAYSPELSATTTPATLDTDASNLLKQIQEIVTVKAPEVLPLLEKFVGKLQSISLDVVEAEKKERSMVIYGVPEAGSDIAASLRQEHTEKAVMDILDELDIEARPVEIYRMGKFGDKPRLIKCVKFLFTTLSRAKKLRSSEKFRNVYVRKSMSPDERSKDRELRKRAHELNIEEHNGDRVFVVYRGNIVKSSDIPNIKQQQSKN